MRTILPFAAVILALISAGCVAYIAWELISELSDDGDPSDSKRS